jgi:DNA-binding NarL/FixJ family response regulator
VEISSSLSVAIVAALPMRRHCQAILTHADGGRWPRPIEVVSARRLLQRQRPAVLLLDAVAAPRRALSVVPIVRRLSPTTRLIVIGRKAAPTEVVLDGVRGGALGYISEDDLARDLQKAIHTVADGEPWLPRRLGAAIVAELREVCCTSA